MKNLLTTILLVIGLITSGYSQEHCKVDLSLILKVSDETPEIGDIVSVNITLANLSERIATGVAVAVTLPIKLSNVTSISPGGYIQGDRVKWDCREVDPNSSDGFVFNIEVAEGHHKLIAEIIAHDQLDSDSEPNNGVDHNGNGLIGSYDFDDSWDLMDEDDEDDAKIITKSSGLTYNPGESLNQLSTSDIADDLFTNRSIDVSITTYPNPTRGILNIDINHDQEIDTPTEVMLVDQRGKRVMMNVIDNQLDLSYLSPGSYVLNIKVGNNMYNKRLILVN